MRLTGSKRKLSLHRHHAATNHRRCRLQETWQTAACHCQRLRLRTQHARCSQQGLDWHQAVITNCPASCNILGKPLRAAAVSIVDPARWDDRPVLWPDPACSRRSEKRRTRTQHTALATLLLHAARQELLEQPMNSDHPYHALMCVGCQHLTVRHSTNTLNATVALLMRIALWQLRKRTMQSHIERIEMKSGQDLGWMRNV